MPQISTTPQPARKIISASMPMNISAEDKAKLEAEWEAKAKEREEAIARETKIPGTPSATLTYRLCKYGHHWNSFYKDEKGHWKAILPAPSLLSSAVDTLTDRMNDEALRK